MTGRKPIFDAEDMDLSDFSPSPTKRLRSVGDRAALAASAQDRGFSDREGAQPGPSSSDQQRRRRRPYTTGRNQQLNLKVTSSAIERFYHLADTQGWVLGEAFEKAVEALERDLAK